MYARLAFAVAININPDILIVDEILSVGDVGFQKKCMDKFNEFKEAGKTVLYVSHGLETVQTFCERAIWLEKGRVVDIGPSFDIVEKYYDKLMKSDDKEEPCEYRNGDQFIFSVNSNVDEFTIPWKKGRNKITFKIDSLDVKEGIYYLDAIFSESQNLVALETQEEVVSFEVKNEGESEGFVFLDSTWT